MLPALAKTGEELPGTRPSSLPFRGKSKEKSTDPDNEHVRIQTHLPILTSDFFQLSHVSDDYYLLAVLTNKNRQLPFLFFLSQIDSQPPWDNLKKKQFSPIHLLARQNQTKAHHLASADAKKVASESVTRLIKLTLSDATTFLASPLVLNRQIPCSRPGSAHSQSGKVTAKNDPNDPRSEHALNLGALPHEALARQPRSQ